MLALAGDGRCDGQFLHIDIAAHDGCQLHRNLANAQRLDAVAVHISTEYWCLGGKGKRPDAAPVCSGDKTIGRGVVDEDEL